MTDSCNKTFFFWRREEHRVSRNPTSYCIALCGASRLDRKKKRKRKKKDKNLLWQAISQSLGRRNEPSDQLFNLSKWIIHNDTLISRRNTIRRAINGSHIGTTSQTEEWSRMGVLKSYRSSFPESQWPHGWFHVLHWKVWSVWPWLKERDIN